MPKIVLDTNIIARAVVSPRGLAAELFQRVISKENLLCTSGFMLAELDRVLRYPRLRKIHDLSDIEIEDFVRSVQQLAVVIDVEAAQTANITRDRDDDPVIATAIRTKAKYLCSIDQDIHAADVVEHCLAFGVEVVSDVTLIQILRDTQTR
jgi:putative PIN family toxin of toxin-antitoxin system